MSCRVVESFRGPWSPLPDVFVDPGVALDFVGSLEPRYGPTIVRVSCRPRDPAVRHAVAGDWLCGDGRNARLVLPPPGPGAWLSRRADAGPSPKAIDLWEGDEPASSLAYVAAACGVSAVAVALGLREALRLVASVGDAATEPPGGDALRLLASVLADDAAWLRRGVWLSVSRRRLRRSLPPQEPATWISVASRCALDLLEALEEVEADGDGIDAPRAYRMARSAESAADDLGAQTFGAIDAGSLADAFRGSVGAMTFLRAVRDGRPT